MTVSSDTATLQDLAPGSHVCWIVDAPDDYVEAATILLEGASSAGEKAVVFGPEGSGPLLTLAPLAEQAADPRLAFLGGGPLDPGAMFAMFREQSALARAEGYERLRVVADMDWLLPAAPTTEAVIAFELLLDRHAKELDATILCAYRTGSFDTAAIAGALCVHPLEAGPVERPQFRLVAADGQTWRLSGEVDYAVLGDFASAISAAAAAGDCVVDVSTLDFIDVASMRAIAVASRAPDTTIALVGARPLVRRGWQLAGFADAAPAVQLVG